MINWIDILSPKLRQLHQDWIHYRGSHLMPVVTTYNDFARIDSVEHADSQTVVVMFPQVGPPLCKHVGSDLTAIMSDFRSGISFSDLRSPVMRTAVSQPFHRIVTSRQPEVRRSRLVSAARAYDYELLLLPFSDTRLHVRIVHAVYDLTGIDWKKAAA